MEVDYGRRRITVVIIAVLVVMVLFFVISILVTRITADEDITEAEIKSPVAETVESSTLQYAGMSVFNQLRFSTPQVNYVKDNIKTFLASQNITRGTFTIVPQEISPRILDASHYAVTIRAKSPTDALYVLDFEYELNYSLGFTVKDASGTVLYSSPPENHSHLDDIPYVEPTE